MKKSLKAGLLIFTLVIPALIFLFLRLFGTNHYNLPYFNPKLDQNGQTLIAAGDTVYRKVDPVSVGQSGAGLYEFVNKLTVVNFLPAACEDSCERVLGQIERVAMLANTISELNLLTLTDVADDQRRSAEIRAVKKWHWVQAGTADSKAWMEVKSVNSIPVESRLTLVDDQGYVRGYYNALDVEEVDRLMAEIKILDYENRKREE